MNIGLSVDIIRLEEKLILDTFVKYGIKPLIIRTDEDPLPIGSKDFSSFTVLIRNISAFNSIYVAASIESSGGLAINSSQTLFVGHDKILTYAKLIRSKLPVPKSLISLGYNALLKNVKKLKYPLIDKPPIGSWGRLVALIKNPEDLEFIAQHRYHFNTPQLRVHILQNIISLGTDIRCLTVGDEVVACMVRKAVKGEWRSNAALGGETHVYNPSPEIEELVIKASKAINAEIAGIDILRNKDGFYINEINVVPEFKVLMKTTNIKIPEIIVKYVKQRTKR